VDEKSKLKLFDENTPSFLKVKQDNHKERLWTLPILTTCLADISGGFSKSSHEKLSKFFGDFL
jgi:hypothetical protein